jgi:hypothetical protein
VAELVELACEGPSEAAKSDHQDLFANQRGAFLRGS